MRSLLLITLVALGGCDDDTVPRASDGPATPESTCETPTLATQAGATLGTQGPEHHERLLFPVGLRDWLGVIVHERHGDPTHYCPDCNEIDIGGCDMCAHSVLTLEAGERRVELDRWWPAPGMGGLTEVTPVQLAGGDLAVVWQREHGLRGISPREGRFARVTPAGDVAEERRLYESEPGVFRAVAHDTDDLVLVVRTGRALLQHVGVHVAVVGEAPDVQWTRSGSSLATNPSAAPFGRGFIVAYSDQAIDTPDPTCAPCQDVDDCFRNLVRETGEGGPGEGCASFFEASPAAGLQAIRVDGDDVSIPVQLATGWYDRVYQGEEQRLYADHGPVALRASPGRLEYVGIKWSENPTPVHVVFELATGSRTETPLPMGRDGDFAFDDEAIWRVGRIWDADLTSIEVFARDRCAHAVIDVPGSSAFRPFMALEEGVLSTVLLESAASDGARRWHHLTVDANL